jgi:hypothetical protein
MERLIRYGAFPYICSPEGVTLRFTPKYGVVDAANSGTDDADDALHWTGTDVDDGIETDEALLAEHHAWIELDPYEECENDWVASSPNVLQILKELGRRGIKMEMRRDFGVDVRLENIIMF